VRPESALRSQVEQGMWELAFLSRPLKDPEFTDLAVRMHTRILDGATMLVSHAPKNGSSMRKISKMR